jgi:hypothetical protein
VNAEEFSQWVLAGKRAMERPGYAASGRDEAVFQIFVEASALKVVELGWVRVFNGRDADFAGALDRAQFDELCRAGCGLPAAALSESELDAVFLDCSMYHPGCTTSRAVAAKVRTTLSN